MSVLLDSAVALLLLGTFAGAVLVIRAVRYGVRAQLERLPAARRRRGVVAGVSTAVGIIAASAVSIAEPFGPNTALYVMAFGGGPAVLLGPVIAVVAIRDGRRRRRRNTR